MQLSYGILRKEQGGMFCIMLIDSCIVPETTYRPGSFSGLMTIYESNYIKLKCLAPTLDSGEGISISRTEDDCDLYLDLFSQEPYTATLKLTYWFEEMLGELIPDPDLTIRVYHDARLAAALSGVDCHHHRKLRELPGPHSFELDCRWRCNITLNKWLDYLLSVGHGFV